MTDDFSFAINVPEGAGLTDLYFSLQAPAKHTWAAFGIGMLMQNSLMFVVYRSADDKGEPTVSPRLTKNHDMPEYHNETVVNVLEGSEVTNDNFIAHIHCKNCRSWDGGNLDENAVKGRFFYALGPEGSLTSDDINAKIEKHSDTPVQFKVDVKAAIGTNGVPSFTSTNSSNTKFNSGDGDLPGFSNGQPSMILAFHAFVLCFAFTIIYPVGYLLLRLFERVWLHWGLQSFGTLFVFMGVGSGIAISKREDIVSFVLAVTYRSTYEYMLTLLLVSQPNPPSSNYWSPYLHRCPSSHDSRCHRTHLLQEKGSSKSIDEGPSNRRPSRNHTWLRQCMHRPSLVRQNSRDHWLRCFRPVSVHRDWWTGFHEEEAQRPKERHEHCCCP